MAEELTVRGVDVKIRGPWIVFLLAIVTLGIYYLVWYYKINRELRDYGRAVGAAGTGDSPLTSLLAVSIGWLILVPPLVSIPVELVYGQIELNKLWQRERVAPAG